MERHRLTPHSQMRRKQMHLTEDRINTVINDPDMRFPGSPCHPQGRTCYQRDELVVVVCDETGEVVTILYHLKEGR